MDEAPKPPKEVLKKAPTLYAITIFKLVKGVVFVVVALIIYAHSDNDLPAEYQKTLDWLHHTWLHLNPERKFWSELAVTVDNLTESRMLHFAEGTLIYSLFSLIEGLGLMFRVKWAGWMAIGESAFFVPIEILEIMHKPNWVVYSVLVVNIFIVWYLFKNRARLFHHHLQPETPQVAP
jgi:uncharacterized membrane protein (DUF2068 family)